VDYGIFTLILAYDFNYAKTLIFKIFNWQGYYEEDLLTEIKIKEGAKKVEFEGIGNFSKQKKYVFGTKSLRNTEDEWNEFIFSKI
jgi:DMSO/TMAO reductase YedYZ molybdopterin-dependent catalytic subunit